MPKQVWSGDRIDVQLDPANPEDELRIKIRGHKGNSIASMTPTDMRALLTELNQRYNLGLNQ